jgi:dephospho-CoA kinase
VLHVGLTGGVASGKSSVAALFASLGAHILDADRLAREVTAPGTEGLRAILAEFGGGLCTASGELDRTALGQRVFQDPAALQRLEGLLHPRIRDLERERARAIAAEHPQAVVIYEAALLLESGGDQEVDRVAVVDVPPQAQWHRALARGSRQADQIRAMMDRQLARPQRLARADDIIDNSGPWSHTRDQVAELFTRYREWAADRDGGKAT